MNRQKIVSFLAAGLVVVSFVIALPVFAQAGPGQGFGKGGRQGGTMQKGQIQRSGVFGTVASINGTTLTVTSTPRPNMRTAVPATAATLTTYTVDASSATVTKNGAASSVSAIATGDKIMVQGTVTGTNVVAKTIRDGVGVGQGQPVIQGNGQPVIAGSVTAISGNIISITNKSNVTYTVDATNAKFVENGITSPTISNVAVGDNLVIQGTVNGSAVTASSIIDQKANTKVNANAEKNNNAGNQQKPKVGIMAGIGNFFKKLFGF